MLLGQSPLREGPHRPFVALDIPQGPHSPGLSVSCPELWRRQFPWQSQDGSSQDGSEGGVAPTLVFVPTDLAWRGWAGGASLPEWDPGLNIGERLWNIGIKGEGTARAEAGRWA